MGRHGYTAEELKRFDRTALILILGDFFPVIEVTNRYFVYPKEIFPDISASFIVLRIVFNAILSP